MSLSKRFTSLVKKTKGTKGRMTMLLNKSAITDIQTPLWIDM